MPFKIYPSAIIPGVLRHGENGDIGDHCFLAGDVTLEENVHLAPGVKFVGGGRVYVKEGATFAPNVVLYTTMPNSKRGGRNKYMPGFELMRGDIVIGRNVFIGPNSVIGCGVTIDDGIWLPPLTHIKPYRHIRDLSDIE